MAESAYDVLGIGNAIVDVLAHTDDKFLIKHGLAKGSMALVDEARAQLIYDSMGPAMEISGGSAANTIAGIASLGGRGVFIGKVKADQLGEVFRHDIRATGVAFDTEPASEGPNTARSFILITPDAQRTMNTHLGACVNLSPDDVDPNVVSGAQVTYLEGYLWDPPFAKAAFRKAMEIAHSAGRKVALTLSDTFCVDRYREEFLDLAENSVDILFANDAEICSLYQTNDFDAALQNLRGRCEIAALTRSELGSVVVTGEEVHVIDDEQAGSVSHRRISRLGGETVIYETYDRTSVESFRGMQLCYRIQLDQHPRDGSFARLQGRPRCSRSTTFLGHETEPGLPTHLGPPSQRRSTLAGRAPRS